MDYDDPRGFAPVVVEPAEPLSRAPAKYTCRGCGYGAEEKWFSSCPSCRRWYNIEGRKRGEKPPVTLATAANAKPVEYVSSGIPELDLVLGGGFVLGGGAVLFGGGRGSGKTTLLLQAADGFAENSKGGPVLFASNEQAAKPILQLASRIKVKSSKVTIVGEMGDVDKILDQADELKAKLVIVDSIKTAFDEDSKAGMGTIEQIGLVSDAITNYGMKKEVAIVIVAHETTFGDLAGGTTLQHLVDTILRIEKNEYEDEDEEVMEICDLFIDGKNRNGIATARAQLQMMAEGLRPLSPKARRLMMRLRNSSDDGPPKSKIVER